MPVYVFSQNQSDYLNSDNTREGPIVVVET